MLSTSRYHSQGHRMHPSHIADIIDPLPSQGRRGVRARKEGQGFEDQIASGPVTKLHIFMAKEILRFPDEALGQVSLDRRL